MSNERYFNFPIILLQDFLKNSNEVLNNVVDYAIYSHTLNLEYGDDYETAKASFKYFGLTGDYKNSFANGNELYDSIPSNSPKVGININIWFDYSKNEKSEFEKVCLLGFLAIKSILQKKTYCKIDNKFWFARMDGKAKSCDFFDLSDILKKYTVPYQARKIKSELVDSWGLITYSRYTRGFYVSYKLELEELVFQAEKRRKSTLEKQKKKKEYEAIKKALLRLKI